jgi:ABC-2 type transport system ATP-binding protein
MHRVIEASDLSVHFRRALSRRDVIKALDGFSLVVEEGDFFALLGENGAGKSTAMYTFLGLQRPTSGSVTMFGGAPELGSEVFRQVAYLPEEPQYHAYLTVAEAIAFYVRLYGRRLPQVTLDNWLERFSLAEFRNLRIDKCSKGMKQKMGIVACLAAEPRLLLLDEPTRGLDPVVVKQVRELLVELNRNGATIVLNSHVLSEIELMANQVAIVKRGKVVRQDLLRNLLHVDSASYTVELDHKGAGDANVAYPEYWAPGTRHDGLICGSVPAARIEEFVRFVNQTGLQLNTCALKRQTLEDTFFDIVTGEGNGSRATAG